ncbi:pirin family protein [Algoriphagus algorifonticola]|uniref:pirin family protein n=1 Tax=Algoriphagus algorifonticola TaxID=2593007 RepID=UPI0011A26B83|nr:pirin family protein [Algoriphagus algorifonticola]
MKTRSVELITQPTTPHFVGDGFRVHNFIPSQEGLSMQRMDPFIMLDYNSPHHFAPSARPKGVGVHPHRGFETVTIAYKGRIAHHDSSGGGGIIGEGDVQWMTAGSGVLHKEYHEEEFSKKGGLFQMVQLWVNLPSEHKMTNPGYQAIKNDSIPKVSKDEGRVEVEVIAGKFEEERGAAHTFSPIYLYNIRMKSGGKLGLSLPENFNTSLLVLEGKVKLNGQELLEQNQLALMKNEEGEIGVRAMEDSLVLLLSGKPLAEPIAAHGPFVMNTRAELMQAFRDFEAGKFGYLE